MNVVDCFMSNAGWPNEEIGRVKRPVLGREGVCIELESNLFLIDMAAEGRCITILTRALQLVPGTTKLLGDPRPTLTSFLLRNGCRKFFSTSRLSPCPVVMHPLFTSFTVTDDDAKSALQAWPMERVYEHFVFVRRWFVRKISLLPRKSPLEKAQSQFPDRAARSWNSRHKISQLVV